MAVVARWKLEGWVFMLRAEGSWAGGWGPGHSGLCRVQWNLLVIFCPRGAACRVVFHLTPLRGTPKPARGSLALPTPHPPQDNDLMLTKRPTFKGCFCHFLAAQPRARDLPSLNPFPSCRGLMVVLKG